MRIMVHVILHVGLCLFFVHFISLPISVLHQIKVKICGGGGGVLFGVEMEHFLVAQTRYVAPPIFYVLKSTLHIQSMPGHA